ncbi:MAG: nucleotide sugar dehydrogenase [Planctomycetes bacterium]|nr:nucleotide sugar dehydrogenase [Planctomycetota bacterium]
MKRGADVTLRDKIENRTAVVGIIGLGYVGLPLANEFAKAGFHVLGFDLAKGKVDAVNRGESYIPDVPTADIAAHRKAGLIEATTDFDRLAEVDTVSICVPTPLSKTKDPDMSYVENASQAVAKRLHEGMLVILESTTYPGTTEELIEPMLSKSGLKVGVNYFLAFSPERVDPGNPKYGVHNTPKVVGGHTAACTEMASLLYSKPIERIFPVSSTAAAEMVKLLENTFRSVNIGLVNEVAIMCEKLKLDVWEVIAAASTKPFGYMTFHPGPGLGGHCIPIDPLYLSWKLRTLNYKARFIDLAAEVNTGMPDYVVELVARALNQREKSVKGSNVLVLGMAYKKDIDDARESPAIDVFRLLEQRGAKVCYHDPYIPVLHGEHGHGEPLAKSVPLTDELLKWADCVVIATDHSSFDYQRIVDNARLVVDSRNAVARLGKKFPNVVRL